MSEETPAPGDNPPARKDAQAEATPIQERIAAAPTVRPRPRTKSPRPRASRAKKGSASAVAPAGIGAGDQVAGYRLEEQIGQGGMAVVYRARDERLDRQVALKLLAPGLAADAAFRQRFIRESRAAAAVDHPNIIPVYDAGDAGGVLFIAMRFVHGGDVRSLLSRHGALPPARAWRIVTQVGAALDAAHTHGLVHRDVKPANILLDSSAVAGADRAGDQADQAEQHVYLSDFGISKQSLATSHLTSTGQFVGTLDYIAPEQIDGRGVDGHADQYSLACAAFELLCGVPPFRNAQGFALIGAHLNQKPPSLVDQRGDLPRGVDRVMAKAMAKSPADRYPSCAQFATDLGRALGLVPGEVTAPAPGPQARAWPATEVSDRSGGAAAQQPATVGPVGPWPSGAPAGFSAAPGHADQQAAQAGQHAGPPGQYPAQGATPPGQYPAQGATPPGQHAAPAGQHAAPPGWQQAAGQTPQHVPPGAQQAPGPADWQHNPQQPPPQSWQQAPGQTPQQVPPGAQQASGPADWRQNLQQPPPQGWQQPTQQPSPPAGWPQPAQQQTPPPGWAQAAQQQTPPPGWAQAAQQQTPPPGWAQAAQQQTPPPGWAQAAQQQTPPPGTQPQYSPYSPHGPYGTYQPGSPTSPGGPPPARRSRGVLIGSIAAGIAVLAAGAAVAVVLLHSKGSNAGSNSPNPPATSTGSTSPASSSPGTSTGTARSQATAISNLLASNLGSRPELQAAVTNVTNCTSLPSSVSTIQRIATKRTREYNQAARLQTGAIANGALLKRQLLRSLRISMNIDDDYLSWAQQQESTSCAAGAGSSSYNQAYSQDNVASSDKMAFVNTWDPIARRYGLETFTYLEI